MRFSIKVRAILSLMLCLTFVCTCAFAADYPGKEAIRETFSERNPVLAVKSVDGQSVTVTAVVPKVNKGIYYLWFQNGVNKIARMVNTANADRTVEITFDNLPVGEYVYLSITTGANVTRDNMPPMMTNFVSAAILAFGVDKEGKALPSYHLSSFSTSGVSVLGIDPNTGETLPLTGAELTLTNGEGLRKYEVKDGYIRANGLKASTPYRLIVRTDDDLPDVPLVFRTSKKPNRMSYEQMLAKRNAFILDIEQQLRDAQSQADLYSIIDQIGEYNAQVESELAQAKADKTKTTPQAFTDADLAALADASDVRIPTFEEEDALIKARAEALRTLVTELERYSSKRVGSTQALADLLAKGQAAKQVEAWNHVNVADTQISFLHVQPAEEEKKTDLTALLQGMEAEIRMIDYAYEAAGRAHGDAVRMKETRQIISKLRKAMPKLITAFSKANSRLKAELTEEDTNINALIDAYVKQYAQDDTGLYRSIPAGSAEFTPEELEGAKPETAK